MNTRPFTIFGAIGAGFYSLVDHYWSWLKVTLMTIAILIVSLIPFGLLFGISVWFAAIMKHMFILRLAVLALMVWIVFSYLLFAVLLFLGWFRAFFHMYDNKEVRASSVMHFVKQRNGMLAFNFIIASLFYSVIVSVGLLLLIIPGIIWATRFGYFMYCMIEDPRLGPVEALKRSYNLVKGHTGRVLCFIVVIWVLLQSIPAFFQQLRFMKFGKQYSMIPGMPSDIQIGISIFGGLVALLNAFFLWPWHVFANIHVYRSLQRAKGELRVKIEKIY